MNTPSPGRTHEGFAVNPEPLHVGKRTLVTGSKGVTREQRRNAWIALGGDPAVWDEEHPLPPESAEPHGRAYAGDGPDDGTDRGAFCPACSRAVEEYVWPCAAESTDGGDRG